jgi:outer membrane lipoprotein-sorting protein
VKPSIRLKLAICSLLVLIVSPIFAVQGSQPQPFSGDIAVSSPKGENVTGKIFFALPKMRWDMNAHGQNVSMITNGTTQTTYMIMHDQHMYMEMHTNQSNPMTRNMPKIDSSFDPNNPCGKQTDVTCKKVGTETVNGRVCDKWVTTDKNGKITTAWIDQKLYFPVRSQSSDGSTMNLTNIKEGAPAASTFEVPAGYQKMDMGSMMGGGKPH